MITKFTNPWASLHGHYTGTLPPVLLPVPPSGARVPHSLTYRGQTIIASGPKTLCYATKNNLLKTGNYTSKYFQVKPIPSPLHEMERGGERSKPG